MFGVIAGVQISCSACKRHFSPCVTQTSKWNIDQTARAGRLQNSPWRNSSGISQQTRAFDSPCLWPGLVTLPPLLQDPPGLLALLTATTWITPSAWGGLDVKYCFFPSCCFFSLFHTAGNSSAPLPNAFPLDNSDCNLFCRLLLLWPLNFLNFWCYCWHVGKNKAIEKTTDAKTTFIYQASSAPCDLHRANQNHSHLMPFPHFLFDFPCCDLGISQQAVLRTVARATKTSSAYQLIGRELKLLKNHIVDFKYLLGFNNSYNCSCYVKMQEGAERFWSFPFKMWNL